MSALLPLSLLLGIDASKLSKEEKIILEIELFIRVCEELREYFKVNHKDYFRMMKFTIEMENKMIDANLTRLIIHDILLTNEYTIEGIAIYTDTHIDVVEEIVSGCNTNPSAKCLRKIIELHRSIRKEFYKTMMKKIVAEYLVTG